VNGKGKNIADTDLVTAAANFTSEANVKKMIAEVENALQRLPGIMEEAKIKAYASTDAEPEEGNNGPSP